MSWKLWLDDQLDDHNCPTRHVPQGFLGAKNVEEAKKLVIFHGVPSFMDLDHDLGLKDDGSPENSLEFLLWLEQLMNECLPDVEDEMNYCSPRPHSFYIAWTIVRIKVSRNRIENQDKV